MNFLETIKEKIKSTFSKSRDKEDVGNIPMDSEKPESVVAYVEMLYKDSLEWRKRSLLNRIENITDPVELWRKCRLLANGNHWEVWGRRNTSEHDAWRHEIVWSAIEDQKRARKLYLSGWHDITVTPNIANINEILRQERDATYWRETINLFIDTGLTEGTAFLKTVFDVSEDPDGGVREIVLDNESIFPTPYATGLKREDGCWYLIYASMQNIELVMKRYPNLDKARLNKITSERAKQISRTGAPVTTKTKLVSVLEIWLDDDTLEKVEFDEEEFQTRIQAITEGVEVKVDPDDDHEEYVKRYSQWLEEFNSKTIEDEDEQEKRQVINELILSLIEEHIEKFNNNPHPKMQKKYPYGRRIVVVEDQLAKDEPNPLKVPWRKLFHKWDMEKVPGSFWGRGIPEILWHSNKMLDTFLSRVADMSITASIPEKWISIENKDLMKSAGIEYTSDPTQVKFYAGSPPIPVQGHMPQEFIVLIGQLRDALEQKIGFNPVTRGESPGPRASGDLYELLLRQNVANLTGEANDNLNDVVEEVIETRIELYKQLYTVPKYYIIHGVPQVVNLSERLKYYEVEENGQLVRKEVPCFEVRVKPNSNFPNQWEYNLSFALKLLQVLGPDGSPLFPEASEFVRDILSEQYPELGRGGKYYKISPIIQLGLQALRQQQIQASRDQETMQQLGEKLKSEGMKQLFGQSGGGSITGVGNEPEQGAYGLS